MKTSCLVIFRKKLFAALLAVCPLLGAGLPAREAHAAVIPAYCLQLDGSGHLPNFLKLFGEDSRLWTHDQRTIFYECAGMDYAAAAARYAAFGLDIDRAALLVSSGPDPNSEVLNAVHEEFDAAIASVGGTPYYSSPWVWGGSSILEGRRTDPTFTDSLAELDDEPEPVSQFTGTDTDGYSRMGAIMNVGWVQALTPIRVKELNIIDEGHASADPSSRLGAYEVTRGYARGTVGYAVHNAIGDIYIFAGTYGQEQIGLVFNSPEARALFNQPIESAANLQMATIEYNYWVAVKQSNPSSVGGMAGSAFTPGMRAWLQEHVYSRGIPALRDVPQVPPPPPISST